MSERPWRSPADDFDPDDPPVVTGVHYASRDFARHVGWASVLKALGLAVIAIFVAGVFTWEKLGTLAKGQAHDEVAPLEQRIGPLEVRMTSLEEQSRSNQRETALDLRELYRVTRDGRRSERLETPPPVVIAVPAAAGPIWKDGGR